MTQTVTAEYLAGISDARATMRKIQTGADSCYAASEIGEYAHATLVNLESTIRSGFAASSPVGQMLRGERDFWRNQIKRGNV